MFDSFIVAALLTGHPALSSAVSSPELASPALSEGR
jgi:hypothetical protein